MKKLLPYIGFTPEIQHVFIWVFVIISSVLFIICLTNFEMKKPKLNWLMGSAISSSLLAVVVYANVVVNQHLAIQQKQYEIIKTGQVLSIKSNSAYLKSQDFKIVSEDVQDFYIEHYGDAYKINKVQEKIQ